MKLLKKNSLLDEAKSDTHPDPRSKEGGISLFQKAFFFTNNQIL